RRDSRMPPEHRLHGRRRAGRRQPPSPMRPARAHEPTSSAPLARVRVNPAPEPTAGLAGAGGRPAHGTDAARVTISPPHAHRRPPPPPPPPGETPGGLRRKLGPRRRLRLLVPPRGHFCFFRRRPNPGVEGEPLTRDCARRTGASRRRVGQRIVAFGKFAEFSNRRFLIRALSLAMRRRRATPAWSARPPDAPFPRPGRVGARN